MPAALLQRHPHAPRPSRVFVFQVLPASALLSLTIPDNVSHQRLARAHSHPFHRRACHDVQAQYSKRPPHPSPHPSDPTTLAVRGQADHESAARTTRTRSLLLQAEGWRQAARHHARSGALSSPSSLFSSQARPRRAAPCTVHHLSTKLFSTSCTRLLGERRAGRGFDDLHGSGGQRPHGSGLDILRRPVSAGACRRLVPAHC